MTNVNELIAELQAEAATHDSGRGGCVCALCSILARYEPSPPHMWINAMSCIRPTDALLAGIGRDLIAAAGVPSHGTKLIGVSIS